jgi:alpha,alpha-trehalose phosphorylase
LTTGDSSLSECIQAIAAADAGKYRSAEEYLVDAAAVDVADTAGNLRDGVHVASAAGTWMAVVYGFGGYRWRSRGPEFSPILPTRASRLRIQMLLRGSALTVDIEEHRVTYQVKSGDPVNAHHYGQEFTVSPASPVSFAGEYRTLDKPPSTVAAGP